ncbi:MAG: DUF4349 domain-containing protein, partial [Anaerolineae bacterium]|nr:DUF4349 domain-containing protein [Anaerolineae bacterium]
MKRLAWIAIVCLVLLTPLLTSCAARTAESQKRAAPEAMPVVREVEVVERPARAADEAAGIMGSAASNLGSAEDRMIIQTVNMSIVVEDTDVTLALVSDLVAAYEGYVADSSRWLVNEQPYARITLRIPAASLDEVRGILRDEAIRVESENTSGEDVTEEFVDLQARLRNLEATEKELLALLTEVRENRGKAEDILAIHRELTNIRSQIESLKGRAQYLER